MTYILNKFEPPILQIALDFTNIDSALKVAQSVIKGGADWLECGTPLIKAEGVKAIKILRENFPDATIVADMKTIDTGYLEAELAFTSGANIVSVLAVADDQTILGALNAAKDYAGVIMADLISHPQPLARMKRLVELGVPIILYHIGIDQQQRISFPTEIVHEIKSIGNVWVAAAGGLNDVLAPQVVRYGADIVIVGRFITKAPNPEERTRLVKDAILRAKNRFS